MAENIPQIESSLVYVKFREGELPYIASFRGPRVDRHGAGPDSCGFLDDVIE
jgi:hypothetical protein